jgi:mevalonate kinase
MDSRTESTSDSFIVSAPGKTIVYGEHAVVYGKAAIAAAISLRSYLHVTTTTTVPVSESSHSPRTVSLRFADISLHHTWNIADLPWKEFASKRKKTYDDDNDDDKRKKKKTYYDDDDDLVTALDPDLVACMQPHIAQVSADHPPDQQTIHHAAASAFLYLFMSLASEHAPTCVYALRSCIPIGAGLGSSASISVCIATALLTQARALDHDGPDPDQLARINRWAFVGELCIHGNPSGVDNTVATHGHAVLFQRAPSSPTTTTRRPPTVSILADFPELPLLILDTRQPKSTAVEVAKVARLRAAHPAVVDRVLDAIDAVVHDVHARLRDPEASAHFGALMSVNHALLASLGVSHPRLERVRFLVDRAGVGWTKLTGAGGGGCAITLLRPEFSPAARGVADGADADAEDVSPLARLDRDLRDEGFVKYETTLGGHGVGVLDPAVVGGKQIDLDMFLAAEGREGVEELVGGRNDDDDGAWKFWRP